jgi:hypothetical protein
MNAQYTIKRNMFYTAKVNLISDPYSSQYKGALYQVNDSSIMISSSRRLKDYYVGYSNFSVSEIEIIDIEAIKTLSKTRIRNGALIGAASGLFIGILMGLLSEPNIIYTNEDMALMGGIGMIPIGALTGGMIGSIGINISINGSMDNFNRNKAKLIKYSLKK